MKPLIIILCFIFLCACSDKVVLPTNPPEHFTASKKISPITTINLEKYNILRPNNCVRYKDWYVLTNYGDRDNHVCFLSTDLSKAVSGLREGNGPLDIVGAFHLYMVDDSIFVMDPNHKKILTVDIIADSLAIKESSNDCEIMTPCVPISRERFIGKNYLDSSMYQLKDRTGKIFVRIGYPNDKNLKRLSYMGQNSIYLNTKFIVSPNKRKYAFATSFTGIYGFGTIINKDSITLDKVLPYYSVDIQEIIDFGGDRVVPSEKSIVNVCSCTCSDKYSMFLFAGYKYGEMNKFANSILIYTWDGAPYMRLDVENDNLSNIYYDNERNLIVGIAHNPEAEIVEYDMTGIIK